MIPENFSKARRSMFGLVKFGMKADALNTLM